MTSLPELARGRVAVVAASLFALPADGFVAMPAEPELTPYTPPAEAAELALRQLAV